MFRFRSHTLASASRPVLSCWFSHDPRGKGFSMSKIVGTIGPVSEDPAVLQQLTQEGLRIMRINFSHATFDEADMRIENLRACKGVHSSAGNPFNLRAVLLDTQGPEIRTGSMKNNEKVAFEAGMEVVLTTDKAFEKEGSASKFYVNYVDLPKTVSVGNQILLDDGLIHLKVLAINGNEVKCLVENAEKLGNRKGVNLPGCKVTLPALAEKDKQDIEFGVSRDIDFIAASFIRTGADVREIKDFVNQVSQTHFPPDHPQPKIISKIENMEGLENFDDILEESDGIMVARGDLGVEVPIHKVVTYQKHMVDKCNQVGKPVIVATQMLESMIRNPIPTRAEVCDVGNAVIDGADAVMLSGEVALGKYPIESVKTMLNVIKEVDAVLEVKDQVKCGEATTDYESIASSTVSTAHALNAKLIVVLTESGDTARLVAKYRPHVPVMCYATKQKVGRQLQVHRGLFPIVTEQSTTSGRPTITDAIIEAKKLGWVAAGDKVVVLNAEEEVADSVGTQTTMRVAQVQ